MIPPMQHVIPERHIMCPSVNRSQPIVVGFCGAKFHGKDTAAKILINHYGFQQVSFADGLKETLCTALRCDRKFFDDPALKETIHLPSGKTYRYWAQICGTEWFRSMWEDVWIEWWKSEIMMKGYERVVSTDLRFPNELAALRTLPNNFVFHVHNPRVPASGDTHASERYHSTFDVDEKLLNDDGIKDLHALVLNAVNQRFPAELHFAA